jgi:hypothetical protein
MKAIGTAVTAGQTIVYKGVCDTAKGMVWDTTQGTSVTSNGTTYTFGAASTVQTKFLPKS